MYFEGRRKVISLADILIFMWLQHIKQDQWHIITNSSTNRSPGIWLLWPDWWGWEVLVGNAWWLALVCSTTINMSNYNMCCSIIQRKKCITKHSSWRENKWTDDGRRCSNNLNERERYSWFSYINCAFGCLNSYWNKQYQMWSLQH